jgi:acyl-CoA thioesterase FadM
LFGNGSVNEFVQIFVAEEREHFARFIFVWANVAADKFIRVFQKTFSQIHREKIGFARAKSELEFESKAQYRLNLRSTICLAGK